MNFWPFIKSLRFRKKFPGVANFRKKIKKSSTDVLKEEDKFNSQR